MNPSPVPYATVLVVDDTQESLRFLTDTLETAGVSVLVATSGQSALDLFGHIVPDLVLMDAVMPGLDGFETTRAIKATAAGAQVPIIFMTGLTESEHVVHALEVGGIDYIRKPIVVEELIARIRVHIANARQTHGSQYALDATGRSLIAIDASGGVAWCTPAAEELMRTFLPDWSQHDHALPEILHSPAARLLGSSAPPGTIAKVEIDADRSLELIVVGRSRPDELLIRINNVDPRANIALLQHQFGLTLREAEVLLWVSYGKPNRVISEILSISPRTVNKHLEQVFEKLGVETRAAAAALAVRTIAQ